MSVHSDTRFSEVASSFDDESSAPPARIRGASNMKNNNNDNDDDDDDDFDFGFQDEEENALQRKVNTTVARISALNISPEEKIKRMQLEMKNTQRAMLGTNDDARNARLKNAHAGISSDEGRQRGPGSRSSIVDSEDAKPVSLRSLRESTSNITGFGEQGLTWSKCPCCKANLGVTKPQTLVPNQYKMYRMFEDGKYVLPVEKLASDICKLYNETMYKPQKQRRDESIASGITKHDPEKDPIMWTPEMVEHHIRQHIEDAELKFRLELQTLMVMLNRVGGQCFEMDDQGKINVVPTNLRIYNNILKQSIDLQLSIKRIQKAN